MLSQVNYRVPNMRFLRERLTVSMRPPPLSSFTLGTPGSPLPAFEQNLVVVKLPRHTFAYCRGSQPFPGGPPPTAATEEVPAPTGCRTLALFVASALSSLHPASPAPRIAPGSGLGLCHGGGECRKTGRGSSIPGSSIPGSCISRSSIPGSCIPLLLGDSQPAPPASLQTQE